MHLLGKAVDGIILGEELEVIDLEERDFDEAILDDLDLLANG